MTIRTEKNVCIYKKYLIILSKCATMSAVAVYTPQFCRAQKIYYCLFYLSMKGQSAMTKKILRVVTLLVAITLLICVFPQAESSAAQSEEYRITQQVEDTYKAALKATGRYSFHGYCGAAVDWQVYTLGIINKVIGVNGNNQYDMYKGSTYSTGGYRIRAYSASAYTLKESLNLLTNLNVFRKNTDSSNFWTFRELNLMALMILLKSE